MKTVAAYEVIDDEGREEVEIFWEDGEASWRSAYKLDSVACGWAGGELAALDYVGLAVQGIDPDAEGWEAEQGIYDTEEACGLRLLATTDRAFASDRDGDLGFVTQCAGLGDAAVQFVATLHRVD